MEATSGVNGSSGTTGATGAVEVDYAALTPEALMTYCATRLRDIDTKVDEKFARQRETSAYTAALNDLQTELNNVAKKTGGGNNGEHVAIHASDTQLLAAIDEKFEAAIKAAPSWAKKEIEDSFAEWKKVGKNDDRGYWLKEVQAKAESLGTLSKQAASSAEIDMIELQSLMSQRQTSIQLITNMLGSLNDSLKAIAMKVGA